jgi:PEGA domain
MALDVRSSSARSFTRWAIMLALPLVLSAAAMPWVLEKLRAERRAVPASLTRSSPDGAAGPDGATEPPRHPEAPSTAEIETARAAEIDAGRIQQRNLAGSVTFAPRGASTAADGERVAPFQGFGLSIESTPAGARVRVGGSDVGETPILTTVDCAPGRDVEVQVEKRGFRPVRRTVRCRADALLELSVPLAR